MSSKLDQIDFYKELNLPRPVLCGLVQRVKSPKGIKTHDTDPDAIERDVYKLDTDLIEIYGYDKGINLQAGLYWVMDIYKYHHNQFWNHYLIILHEDGTLQPVAEYLKCHDSKWMKKAIKVVKAYFKGEELPEIKITPCKTDIPTKKCVSS